MRSLTIKKRFFWNYFNSVPRLEGEKGLARGQGVSKQQAWDRGLARGENRLISWTSLSLSLKTVQMESQPQRLAHAGWQQHPSHTFNQFTPWQLWSADWVQRSTEWVQRAAPGNQANLMVENMSLAAIQMLPSLLQQSLYSSYWQLLLDWLNLGLESCSSQILEDFKCWTSMGSLLLKNLKWDLVVEWKSWLKNLVVTLILSKFPSPVIPPVDRGWRKICTRSFPYGLLTDSYIQLSTRCL